MLNIFNPNLPAGDGGRRRLVQLLVAAQVLFILAIAGAGYATSELGQHLVLAASPIDPTELKAGDFVRLHYQIGALPLAAWHAATPPQAKQKVYVLLQSSSPDSAASVAGVYAQAPVPTAGQAVLRGWVSTIRQRSFALRFGLERYYVPAASPLRREKPRRLHALRVRMSVAPWGQARITEVELGRRSR